MRWAGYYPWSTIPKCAATLAVPTHPSGPVGHTVPSLVGTLRMSTLACSVSVMDLVSVSWNSVSFMEFS